MTEILERHHALVTGGGGGIGASIALTLAAAGAAVTICGRRETRLAAISRQSPRIHHTVADVVSESDTAGLIENASAQYGPIDILIANAGAAEAATAVETSLELWNRMLAVNLTGAFLSARQCLPQMQLKKSGRIVFIASTAGQRGYGGISAYCAAKHGVIGLMRALAREVARDGITVNAVCPGYTETGMLESAVRNVMAASGRDEAEARKRLSSVNPMGRFITPDEVAATVLWLCRPESAAVTGQAISVSGGET